MLVEIDQARLVVRPDRPDAHRSPAPELHRPDKLARVWGNRVGGMRLHDHRFGNAVLHIP